MPRKAPKEVVEHRITLGDFERKEFKQSMDAYQLNHNIRTGLIAGGIGLVAYAAYKIIPGLFDFFTLDPEQQAVYDRLFNPNYDPNNPEWTVFGNPSDREQLDIMYAQNVKILDAKKNKMLALIQTYESGPFPGKGLMTKSYNQAQEYIATKDPAIRESLERWRSHYMGIL